MAREGGYDLRRMIAGLYPRKQGNYREYAFLALGFQYGESAIRQWVQKALTHGEALACRNGVYYRLPDASGAEFWLHTRPLGQVCGADVFYRGKTSVSFGLLERRIETDQDPLEGGFYGWSNAKLADVADAEDPFWGDFPTAFTIPDFARHDDLILPVIRQVQLVAFAKGLSAYVDKADFEMRRNLNVAEQSFFPANNLQGWVTFSGKVLDSGICPNGITRQSFTWAVVEAYGATLDVVANPRTVRGKIVPDGYILGHFWLMGRLI